MNRKKPTIFERLIKRLVKWLFFSGSAEKQPEYRVMHEYVFVKETGTWEYLCKMPDAEGKASKYEITDNYTRSRLNAFLEAKRVKERDEKTRIALARTTIYTWYKTHGGHFVASWASSVPDSIK